MRAALILACLTASLLLPAAAQDPAPAAATTPGKVRVVTRNLEPFSFESEGKRVGYAAEL